MTTRHYSPESASCSDPVACGGVGYNFGSVTNRSLVTCKRCLASLAKRDRELQRKARGWFVRTGPARDPLMVRLQSAVTAFRAIAAEEGRAS